MYNVSKILLLILLGGLFFLMSSVQNQYMGMCGSKPVRCSNTTFNFVTLTRNSIRTHDTMYDNEDNITAYRSIMNINQTNTLIPKIVSNRPS